MLFKNKNLTLKKMYELIWRLIEELKLRKYSYCTGKAWIRFATHLLEGGANKETKDLAKLS